MKKRNLILLIIVITFGIVYYFMIEDIKKEKLAKSEIEINEAVMLDYDEAFDNFRDKAWIDKIKSHFEELFNVNMQGFNYVDRLDAFSDDIFGEAIILVQDVGDYSPFGFIDTEGERGYILHLENDGTSHLWELNKEENWLIVNKEKKQGESLDIWEFYEEIEPQFLEQHPEYKKESNT